MNTETNPINGVEIFTNPTQNFDLEPYDMAEIEDLHLPENFQSIRIKSPIIPSNKLSISFSENINNDDLYFPKSKSSRVRRSLRFAATIRNFKKSESRLEPRKLEIGISEQDKKKMVSRFFKLMVVFYLVKKFIKKLRLFTFPNSLKQMGKAHFKILNDLAFFKEGLENQKSHDESSLTIRIKRKIMDLTENKFISRVCKCIIDLVHKMLKFHIYPTHNFFLFWEFFVMIVTIFYFIVIPIEIAFGQHDRAMDKPFISTILVFFIDILLNFNTAFYSRGQLITSKAKIFENYLKGRFFTDLFSLSYLILNQLGGYSSENWPIKAFAFTFLLRVKNLSRVVSQFEEFLFCDEDSSNIVSFIRLLVNILLFSHWSACIWKIVGTSNANSGWLAYYHVDNQGIFSQYVFSLYYVVVVINTVGFGDVVSQTTGERVFTIFFINTACVIFAYTINRIGLIVQNINKKEFEFKKTMNTINGYMKFKNIGFELKIKTRNYLEYIWHAEKMQNLNATQEIINRLSKSLKEELLLNANGFTLKKIPLFGNNFSDESLRKLVCEMKEINLTPEDIIYHENQTTDQNIYIIRDGEVELSLPTSDPNHNIGMKVLKKGDYFGQISFFAGLPRNSTAKSVSFSSLFVLNKETFISIISQNSADYERFCVIKDEISLYQEYHGIFYLCPACFRKCHTVQECPCLHLNISRARVLEKHTYSLVQKNRVIWNRLRREKHPNTLKSLTQYKICAKAFTDSLRETDDYEMKNSVYNYDEEINKNSFQNFDIEQDEHTKSKEKIHSNDLKNNVMSSHSLIVESDPNKEALKPLREREEGSPGLRRVKTLESSQGQKKWWFFLDNSTVDIDCGKNFDFYFPAKNMENLIVVINEMALKKQKKLKSFFPLSELWSTDKTKSNSSFRRNKRNISNVGKIIRRPSLFLTSKTNKSLTESLWKRVSNYLISIFKKHN